MISPQTVYRRLTAMHILAMCCALLLFVSEQSDAARPPLSARAQKLADEAYKAVERGELDRAMRLSSQALKFAPRHPELLLLQADILTRQQKHAEALERIRGLTPAELGVHGLSQRGYLSLHLGSAAAAEADFAAAINLGGLSAEERANIASELGYLALRRNDDAAALKWFEMALAGGLSAKERANVASDLGYLALRRNDDAAALKWFEMALEGGLEDKERANIASELGYLALRRKDDAAAIKWFQMALEGSLSAEERANVASDLAYAALRRNDDAAALKWFQVALESPKDPASSAALYSDAGYAALRLGRNNIAVDMLSRAVDAWHAAPTDKKPFDESDLFGMRRSIDRVSRRWGAILSIGHSATQATAGSGLAAAGRDLRLVQAGAEVFYTPERFGYRDERVFQFYASMFQSISANEEGFATGAASRIAGVGVRYKPLREHNLVFAFERRLAIGDQAGEDDWLVRMGWSASRQYDWHPRREAWTTWQVYTESAYFTGARRLVQPFEARLGRSWKLPRWHGVVMTPHIAIAGEYDKAQAPRTAAGIGPGVAMRYWFGETRYRAFPRHWDVSFQYRYRLTEARRGGGVFGQVTLSF